MYLAAIFAGITALFSASKAAPTTRSEPNLVVAHFIVGYTYSYTESTWASDIALAQANGINGFALNYGIDTWQPSQLANAYAAAEGYPSFMLFLSADMSSLASSTEADGSAISSQVATFVGHPNQLTINGGVVFSTFSGESSEFGYGSVEAGWQAVISAVGSPVTFLPFFSVDPSTFGNYPVISGALNWNAGWPMSNTDITFTSDQQYIDGLDGKLYVAPCTPNFFTHYTGKNFIYRDDDNLFATRWEMLIEQRSQIVMVEILTWNDYSESHYIGPLDGAQPADTTWANGYPHTAWLDLVSYYAPAFQSGVYPDITNDKIYIYARPHPKAAIASGDSVGQPTGWDSTDDNFYALILATASGSLILGTPPTPSSATPTSSSAGPQTFAVTAGVNKFSLPLVPSNGMRATLMRGSDTVLDLWPQNYTFNPDPVLYNFNAFVEMAST